MRKLTLLGIMFFSFLIPKAQNNGRLLDWPMKLSKAAVRITADAFTATSFIELEFCNSNDQEIEGLYRFSLEPGQVITHFQLELNGKFRDGSIEEKWKANNAYNSIVGKRIDPALINMESENNYSLRIYPVPARSCRKVTLTIQQLLKKENGLLHFQFPLHFSKDTSAVDLTIQLCNSPGYPFINGGLLKGTAFEYTGGQYRLEWKKQGLTGTASILFSIPVNEQEPEIAAKRKEDKTFFAIRLRSMLPPGKIVQPNRIAVWWDVSASAGARDIEKEIRFLKKYIDDNDISSMMLYCFNHRLIDSMNVDLVHISSVKWDAYLRSKNLEGASDFSVIDLRSGKGDINFLFSDGVSTVNGLLPVPAYKQLNCILTAPVYDSIFLQQLTAASGGTVINLDKLSLSSAVSLANYSAYTLRKIEARHSPVHIDQPLHSIQGNHIYLSGYFGAVEDTIELIYGNNYTTALRFALPVGAKQYCMESAVDRLLMLESFGREIRGNDWYKLLAFGKKEKVVTHRTSFIVLERVLDYIQYNITPPKELEAECNMSEFVKNDAIRKKAFELSGEQQVLQTVVAQYNQRLAWNGKPGSSIILTPEDFNVNFNSSVTNDRQNPGTQSSYPLTTMNSMNEVVVTALGVRRSPKEIGYSVSVLRNDVLGSNIAPSFGNTLSGKVAGIQVINTNSGIAPDLRIVLRGNRSMIGKNQALVVLDGVPVPNTAMNYLNPNDISWVYVLKGSQATTLYGPDGVNGVLIIHTKKVSNNRGMYKLKNMEDVEYVVEMKRAVQSEKMNVYRTLKKEYGYSPVFYLDMADLLFESGLSINAMEVLMSAAEIGEGDRRTLRAIGFMLEKWQQFDEAGKIYQSILRTDSLNIEIMHDLALVYYRSNKYQLAVDLLYKIIKMDLNDQGQLAAKKSSLLQEMNAIISLHRDQLDLSGIQPKLLQPVEADLRILVSFTNNYYPYLTFSEPGKTEVNRYGTNKSESFRAFFDEQSYRKFSSCEYQVKEAKKGKYEIRLNYQDWYNNQESIEVPSMARIMLFRNFGKPGQQLSIENVMLNNQRGEFGIAEIVWR